MIQFAQEAKNEVKRGKVQKAMRLGSGRSNNLDVVKEVGGGVNRTFFERIPL